MYSCAVADLLSLSQSWDISYRDELFRDDTIYYIIGEAYKRVGDDMTIIFGDDKDSARQDILSRIHFYAYPYAVHASRTSGWGFLFVQSDSSLAVCPSRSRY